MDVELDPRITESLLKLGYSPLTQIQERTIPLGVAGTDFYALSPTGTGKTAAFLVPIIQHILTKPGTRALIIEPTRELVIQAANECRKICEGMGITTVAAYGGTPPQKQEEMIAKGAQIVIGNPTRLHEILQKGVLKPSNYSILVLDEADRLLSVQFEESVLHLASRLPHRHQTMLFSVQMPKEAYDKAKTLLRPGFPEVKVGKVAAATITHFFTVTEDQVQTLASMLAKNPVKSMVFCATNEEVEDLANTLNKFKIYVIQLNSNIKPARRHSAMRRFISGEEQILICTDVAARGIHFPDVQKVYSIGLPSAPEFYIHRAGRTGRMNEVGECISIITADEQKRLSHIYHSCGVTATKI
jgi:superfamily II DNA/RNA helicase